MSEHDAYGGPFFVPEIDADQKGITTDAAARALAEPGLPLNKASVFFRNCATNGLVHPYTRLRTGLKPYLYRADQLLIAAVLHRVAEAAFSDKSLRQKVSHTLNAWNADDLSLTEEAIREGNAEHFAPRSPAAFALYSFLHGKRGFSFEIRTCRQMDRGTLTFDCRLGRQDTEGVTRFRLDPEQYSVRSAFVTSVDDILIHLTREREIAN
ncbi:MAG: hypothetical protein QNJ44_21215 [Rhodobacter sp.]|nr:hypothetical protein [Rhodobacter sp.]